MSEFRAKIIAELDTSKVEQKINELNDKKIKFDADTGSAQKNIAAVNKNISTANTTSKSFGDTLKKSLNIGSAAAIVAKGIRLITQAADEAVQSVKNIDSALTQVQIVTGTSSEALKEYASDAAEVAKTIGSNITSIIESTETFARLGYSLTESLDLSDLVNKYANVADTTVDDATDSITSIMKAFSVEPAQMENVLDKLVAVGQEYAISASELGQALQSSGSALEAGGNTIEQSVALLAAGNAAVQNASTVGNALKTTSMRIRSSVAELEEMGETVDDLVKSTSSYRAEIKALSGIDIMIDDNTYKSTYQILEEIANVWDDLSDIEQATLLEDLAGKRNSNTVKSVITNLKDLQGAYQSASNATGALAEANDTYMDSIEAKTKQLQAAFEALSTDTISSDLYAGIIDATTSIVTFLDESNLLKGTLAGLATAGAIKGFTTLASGISNAAIKLNEFNSATQIIKAGNLGEAEIQQLAVLTSNLSKSQLTAFLSSKALTAEQRTAILTAQGLSKEEAQAALTTMGLSTSESAAAASTFNLSGAFKGLWATLKANPLILVITGVTAAVTAAISAFSSYKESVEEQQQAIIDAADEAKEHIESLESAWQSYSSLDADATEKEQTEALQAVVEQLNKKTKALLEAKAAEEDYADTVKGAILADYEAAAGNALAAATQAKDKISEEDNNWFTNNGYSEQFTNTTSDKIQDRTAYNIAISYIEDTSRTKKEQTYRSGKGSYYTYDYKIGTNLDTDDVDAVLQYYEQLQDAIDAIEEFAVDNDDDSVLSSNYYLKLKSIVDADNAQNIEDYITNYAEYIYDSVIAEKGIPETTAEFKELKSTMLEQCGDSKLLADTIKDRLTTAYSDLADSAEIAESTVSNTDFTIDTETLEDQLSELQDALSEISDNYQKLNDIVDDYNENGNFTLDNLDTLLSVGNEYIDTLFNENGQLQLNKDAYVALAKAKIEDIRYTMLESAISDINQMSKDDETESTDSLAESTGNLTEETLKLVVAQKLAEGVDESAIQSRLKTYSQYMAILDNVEAGLESNAEKTLGLSDADDKLTESLEEEKSALEDTKEALEEQKEALEDSKEALEKQKEALEDTKDGYNNAIDSIKDLIDWTQKYIEQVKNDEIDVLEEKKSAFDDLIDNEKEALQKEKDLYEYQKSIKEKQNSVASNALAAAVANLDDSSAGQKAAKEANDNLAESQDDIRDYLYEHELEVRENALDELKEKTDDYYDSQIDTIQEYLSNEVALYKDACSMIDNDTGDLYGKLLDYCQTYTTTTEAEFNYMWNSAQSALEEYNTANLGTWELLNELQQKTYDVDASIEAVTLSIEEYETRIDEASESIEEYGNKIDELQEKIENLSNTASNTTIKVSTELDDATKPKWYYWFNGTKYTSAYEDKDTAIHDILSSIENNYGGVLPSGAVDIYGTIKAYAKGTRNSKREVAKINEEGQETLFAKTSQGDYALLQPGTQVFTKEQTDTLYELSKYYDSLPVYKQESLSDYFSVDADSFVVPSMLISNQKMIDDALAQVLNDTTYQTMNNITNNTNTSVNIQGDATQSTVKALQSEADKIVKRATENVMNIALRNKNII